MGRRHGEFHVSGKMVRWILAAVFLLTPSVTLAAQEAPTDERTACRNAGFQPAPVGSIAAPACAGCKPALPLGAAQSPASAQAPSSQPSPQNQSSSQKQPSLPLPNQVTASPRNESNIIGFLPPFITRKKLTPKNKFEIYFHQNYGPTFRATGRTEAARSAVGTESRSSRPRPIEPERCWRNWPGMKTPATCPRAARTC